MATYLSTIRFSDRGIQAVGETTKRAKLAAEEAASMGVAVKEIYWTLGETDGMLVFDAPDEETAAALLLKVGAAGAVHTSTCRAFTSEEIDAMLAKASLG